VRIKRFQWSDAQGFYTKRWDDGGGQFSKLRLVTRAIGLKIEPWTRTAYGLPFIISPSLLLPPMRISFKRGKAGYRFKKLLPSPLATRHCPFGNEALRLFPTYG
jgi:hypothetical protein